jgi:hypothetical protein
MGATCIATRGYICPPPKDFIQATTCDHPTTHTVVEVRPTLRGTYEAPVPEVVPSVASAQPLTPTVESVTDPPAAPPTSPSIASVTPLKPAIVSAEED